MGTQARKYAFELFTTKSYIDKWESTTTKTTKLTPKVVKPVQYTSKVQTTKKVTYQTNHKNVKPVVTKASTKQSTSQE